MNEHFDKGIFIPESEKLQFYEFKKDLIGITDKFIQLYFRGKPYLRIGKSTEHKEILINTLKDFGLEELKTKLNSWDIEIPYEKDLENRYQMVGAGTISKVGGKLYFEGKSMHYQDFISGPNKEHLEDIFGKEKIVIVSTDNPGETILYTTI